MSSMISSILSSALGILCAVGYLMLFKRFTTRALKSPGPSQLAWTVSGLFSRLILTGLVLFFISRIPSVNFLVVLMNFVIMVQILFLWIARGFSRQLIYHK